MLPTIGILLLALLSSPPTRNTVDDPVYGPLWLYQGGWQIATKNGEGKPAHLENQCALVGKYFTCQQTVNGKVGALIVFVPAEKPGHYYTQAILPEGHATGRGELEIDSDHWTYSGKDEVDGKTVYSRTTNVFKGKDHIHYEQSESADGVQWTVKNSGDEERVASSPKPGH
jgi:hypothetical protein